MQLAEELIKRLGAATFEKGWQTHTRIRKAQVVPQPETIQSTARATSSAWPQGAPSNAASQC